MSTEQKNSSSPFQDKLCPRCKGSGICTDCQGKGFITCLTCSGKGTLGTNSKGIPLTCRSCQGKKVVPCPKECPSCGGTGEISSKYQDEIAAKYATPTIKEKTLWASQAIIIICTVIYLAVQFLPFPYNRFLYEFCTPYAPSRNPQAIWHLLTCAFLHVDLLHFLCNMYCTHIFGQEIESLCGGKRFLGIFILGAVVGSLASSFLSSGGIGASGGLFALGFAYWGFNKRWGLDSLQTANSILYSMLFILFIGWFINFGGIRLDNFAHLGGGLTGIIYAFTCKKS